ncbi:WD40 repeat-like protein [Microstroma glucosiphilum]|uniref:WD40 repeat-like protein n=1 Tax=Pseudomicrostroma glucosiphilum TaxID=1684307 RepID=A0A316U2T7_9BASI|nr:WD40 repeat-like protein [Pseudomicrostroma glucosiphilum]PWN19114.1 WD40 repeat-like protein [Pseudomicrostroma glucosiphilum]
MASTLAWPRTPSTPSSSASSSSSRLPTNALSSSPPPHPASSFEALLRTPPPSSSSYAAAQGVYTPPSSPPLPPLQPTPTSSRTLHLRSPHKPVAHPARSTVPLPASSPSSSRRKQQLIVKGNVTPSRASAFFHPRPQRRDAQGPSCTPSSTRGYYASLTASSPSSHTSARRGVKRQRRPEESIPESPSSSRRGRRDRMMLEGESARHWDDSSDDDDEAGQMGDRRLFDWGASDDEDLMSLATSAPRSMTRRGPTSPSIGSAARRAGLPTSQPSRTRRQQRTFGLDDEATPSPRKPVPMAMRGSQAGVDLASAMATLRCGAGAGAGRGMSAMNAIRNRVSHVPAYQKYRSHPDHSIYTLPSLANGGETLNQPLACAYSYSSRSYTSSRQWLAVGDNEGVLSLLDTSRDQTLSTYRSIHDGPAVDRPTWQATIGSLFSVSWRFDDAYLASSGSDYTTKIWDTSTLSCVHSFVGSRGTSRAIEWDPHSGGNLLASGGRDGAIHVYDLRMAQKEAVISTDSTIADDADKLEPTSPLLSLWSAHAPSPALTAAGFRARSNTTAKGVTSLIYHPHRPHALFTAGCADATIKLWDLRFAVDSGAEQHRQQQQRGSEGVKKAGSKVAGERIPFADLSALTNTTSTSTSSSSSSAKRKIRKPRKARPGDPSFVLSSTVNANPEDASNGGTGLASDPLEIKPLYESGDLSLSVGKGWNARSHGISCLAQGGGKIFAAATDGRIYSLPLSSLSPSSSSSSPLGSSLPPASASFANEEEPTVLYHSTQLGNSLYNRLALCPDERTLAIGCNNGSVVLWDTKARSAAVLGSDSGSRSGSGSRGGATAARRDRGEDSEEEEDEEEENSNPFSRHGLRRHPGLATSSFLPSSGRGSTDSGSGSGSGNSIEGHRLNCEINALDWCFDAYAGWRLATCGDDMTVRVWEGEMFG